jgi:hypothetical protein
LKSLAKWIAGWKQHQALLLDAIECNFCLAYSKLLFEIIQHEGLQIKSKQKCERSTSAVLKRECLWLHLESYK